MPIFSLSNLDLKYFYLFSLRKTCFKYVHFFSIIQRLTEKEYNQAVGLVSLVYHQTVIN